MTTADRPPELDDILLRVGHLNYAWTNTESLLIHLIAGLCRVDKDTALIVFLTLNTTRARLDLVERLAKMERTSVAEREGVLAITKRIQSLSGLRNRYNHCIYAFDPEGGQHRTILMRIADRRDHLRMGQVNVLDSIALTDIEEAIAELRAINRAIWTHVGEFKYPV
ncbi:hypothetical protein [Aestuariivita boseongensis]|uniref:hypothetical protein n=1 Tax=Aestuariivita boseongensis TaxID=1470562 RepID=UPI000680E056|nr:hypothetical protein [Aestuariivita boseongensis]